MSVEIELISAKGEARVPKVGVMGVCRWWESRGK